MNHVFVSYSRSDAEWVRALVRRLEEASQSTWLDQRDIPLTLPWFEEIGDAILAADLFLICDSPASRESASCAAETRLAFEAARKSVEVEVGSNLDAALKRVKAAISELDQGYRARTELAVRTRDWDRGGRERGALANARARRRLAVGSQAAPPLSAAERAFLHESRSRARRRTAATVVLVSVIGLSLLVALVLRAARDLSASQNDAQAAAYMQANEWLEDDEPFRALDVASRLGDDESASKALVISAALERRVPDDGFAVPGGANAFASAPISDQVVVRDSHGRAWQRAADARTERSAQPLASSPPPGASDVSSLRFRTDPDSSMVEVLDGGQIWRRIAFPQPVEFLRLSPNGRELAALSPTSIEIADLRLGKVKTTLLGVPVATRDLAWSSDGRRLWALGDGFVVSWLVRDGRVLIDDPQARFEALLPAAGEGEAWVVGNDGVLSRFATADGEISGELRAEDEIHSAAGSPDGSIAALSGERGLWLIDLDDGSRDLIRLPDCTLGRASFLDRETLFLPCLSGKLLRISASRKEVEGRIDLGPSGVFAVRMMPAGGPLLASDTLGYVYAIDSNGERTEIFKSTCGASVSRIAASSELIVPAGSGASRIGCSARGIRQGDQIGERSGWQFDFYNDPVDSALGEAAAVSLDSSAYAIGYGDGSVVVHPTVNITPSQEVTNVVGEVRDMSVSEDGALLVATAAGIVQRLPFCGPCLSNAALARIARQRVERAVEIGIARHRARR